MNPVGGIVTFDIRVLSDGSAEGNLIGLLRDTEYVIGRQNMCVFMYNGMFVEI